ncbi:MAG: Zn-ribbon domain-containing OB-fold protein [Burkholderiales bacterium]
MNSTSYLPSGMPAPVPAADGLDAPYWEGVLQGKLKVQRCSHCGTWQWGPEWLCHACNSFELAWEEVPPHGLIYSWQRPWHPVHPALRGFGPYLVVMVELPHAGGIRMVGNLLGPVDQTVQIGAPVTAVFERHDDALTPYALVHWRTAG